jgi:hypothetical protein
LKNGRVNKRDKIGTSVVCGETSKGAQSSNFVFKIAKKLIPNQTKTAPPSPQSEMIKFTQSRRTMLGIKGGVIFIRHLWLPKHSCFSMPHLLATNIFCPLRLLIFTVSLLHSFRKVIWRW